MKKISSIPKAFVGFLIASLFFWSLIKLSKEYATTIPFRVSFQELPQDKLFQKKPIESIDLLVKGSGFKLLAASVKDVLIELKATHVSLETANKYQLLLKNQQTQIQNQLPSGLVLEAILQDVVYLYLGKLTTKKVPVSPRFNISYQIGYGALEVLKMSPDSVLVSGPKSTIEKLSFVALEPVLLSEVSTDFKNQVAVVLPEGENIKMNAVTVSVVGKVGKFTEGSFELPFQIKNIPVGLELKTFPKTVKVVYKVGLKNFNKINASLFTVVCDYQQTTENKVSYLIPKIAKMPALTTSVKIVPAKIDFLIQK